jgi:peptidoglycan/xylan/chitin deacetylase (PgdA/CDA1 family)
MGKSGRLLLGSRGSSLAMTSFPPDTAATPRWRPGALLMASAAVHAGAAVSLLAAPAQWPWALAALAANHALITATGLWPRSSGLGPNVTRLPGATATLALTIDDGPDAEVTPQVLDLLRRDGVKATFFLIAERAEAHPALVRRIVAEGHAVGNHSFRHRHNFSLLGPRGFAAEIERAQATLERLSGRRPAWFRAPAGLRNPFLDPVLHRLGLTLVSWTRRGFDTRERDPATVLARLTRGLRGGDILLLHDGHCARDTTGRPVVLEVLPRLLEQSRRAGWRWVTLDEALPARTTPTPSSSKIELAP